MNFLTNIFLNPKKTDRNTNLIKEVWLLVSLTLFLLLPIPAMLFPDYFKIIFLGTYSLLLIGGIKSVASSRRDKLISLLFGGISFVFIWAGIFSISGGYIDWLKSIFLLLFFLFLAYHVFQSIGIRSDIGLHTILASISGYLLLGIIGGLLFQMLELSHPGSFHSSTSQYELFDLHYFGFVTLTTLGYGDIIPITHASKSLSLVISIAGQLYLAIIMAILVGKFITNQKQ